MWRMKTKTELLADGWTDTYDFNPPQGCSQLSYSPININACMFEDCIFLSQEDIESVMVNNDRTRIKTNGNSWAWTPHMFTMEAPIRICDCNWNRHPLFCRCK